MTSRDGEGHEVGEGTSRRHLVQLEDITVRYRLRKGILSRTTTEVVAVDRVSIGVTAGTSLGIVGATGSGKSTIAQVIMGMVAPTSGTVRIGTAVPDALPGERTPSVRVQVVLQDPYSSLDPRMRVGKIIAEPLTVGREGRRRLSGAEIDQRVGELLDLVGLPRNRAARYPHQFSGGQRQRIAIARALAPEPDLIILDEPTSALDVSIRSQILNLLRRLQGELGVTYVVISHDLVTVAYLASVVAVMHQGRIVEYGPTKALYTSPRHPYTLELLTSRPGQEHPPAGLGYADLASAESLPAAACRYAYRCALRAHLGDPARCVEEDPSLEGLDGHAAACHFPDAVAEFGALGNRAATGDGVRTSRLRAKSSVVPAAPAD
jgi:oligopeptide/dipeptide ABC transporter ATP-binding protein